MTSIAALTIKKACSEKKRKSIDEYADKYADIPLVGRTVFEQQRLYERIDGDKYEDSRQMK